MRDRYAWATVPQPTFNACPAVQPVISNSLSLKCLLITSDPPVNPAASISTCGIRQSLGIFESRSDWTRVAVDFQSAILN